MIIGNLPMTLLPAKLLNNNNEVDYCFFKIGKVAQSYFYCAYTIAVLLLYLFVSL